LVPKIRDGSLKNNTDDKTSIVAYDDQSIKNYVSCRVARFDFKKGKLVTIKEAYFDKSGACCLKGLNKIVYPFITFSRSTMALLPMTTDETLFIPLLEDGSKIEISPPNQLDQVRTGVFLKKLNYLNNALETSSTDIPEEILLDATDVVLEINDEAKLPNTTTWQDKLAKTMAETEKRWLEDNIINRSYEEDSLQEIKDLAKSRIHALQAHFLETAKIVGTDLLDDLKLNNNNNLNNVIETLSANESLEKLLDTVNEIKDNLKDSIESLKLQLMSKGNIIIDAPDSEPFEELPSPPISNIRLPIVIKKSDILALAERKIPTNFADHGSGEQKVTFHKVPYAWNYDIDRVEPMKIEVGDNDHLDISTRIEGRGDVDWESPSGSTHVELNATVGTRGSIFINQNWQIDSTLEPIISIHRAEIPVGFTIFGKWVGFDVSVRSKMDEKLRPHAVDLMNSLNQKLSAIDIKTPIEKVWSGFEKPIKIAKEDKEYWLSVNPKQVYYSGMREVNDELRLLVGIDGQIVVSVGEQPKAIEVSPLPVLNSIDVENNAMRLDVPVAISYDDLKAEVASKVISKSVSVGPVEASIKDMDIYGNGGRLVIKLDLLVDLPQDLDDPEFPLYFTARPIYNPDTKSLKVAGLMLDTNSERVLNRDLKFLQKLDSVLERVEWDLSSKVDKLESDIKDAVTEIPLDGAKLKGNVENFNFQQIYITSEGIKVYMMIDGSVELHLLDLDSFVPR